MWFFSKVQQKNSFTYCWTYIVHVEQVIVAWDSSVSGEKGKDGSEKGRELFKVIAVAGTLNLN